MATIDSVELYLGLSSVRSGWDVVVDIHAFSADPHADPEPESVTLGTKTLDVVNVPLISGPGAGWVVFTFDVPITIDESSFIALLVTTTAPSVYQATPLRWFYAQDYAYATAVPWAGKERFHRYSVGTDWVDTGATVVLAYKINCTDSTDNDATNPSASYFNFGNYSKMGHRSYMDAAGSPPEKAINPKPIDTADDVILNRTTIAWEDGGGATSYNIYYGDDVDEVADADTTDTTGIYLGNQAELSLTITGIDYGSPFEYLVTRYWRIDAVNDVGMTTGDAWSFIVIAFNPPLPTGENNMFTVRRLVAAAKNTIWIEDI